MRAVQRIVSMTLWLYAISIKTPMECLLKIMRGSKNLVFRGDRRSTADVITHFDSEAANTPNCDHPVAKGICSVDAVIYFKFTPIIQPGLPKRGYSFKKACSYHADHLQWNMEALGWELEDEISLDEFMVGSAITS
jgi:hypothetical protein